MLTDGGVYDNLGISCLLPGRSAAFSTNAFDVDFIIACDAGHGMPSGEIKPYLWGSRMIATINTIHRRTHVQAYDRSEEHKSELQSLMRISYAVFCLKKKKQR